MLRWIVSLMIIVSPCLAETAAAIHSNPPVKIGVILPLTGSWANWGERIRQGLELSNQQLGDRFELIFQDEGVCEPSKGIQAAHFLFSKGVKILVIGCVATTRALIPEMRHLGVLAFSAGLLDRESFQGGAMVVNFATQVGTEAQYQAAYIEKQGYKSIGLVRPQEPFGEELASVLKSELARRGIKVLFDDNDTFSTNDFGATALKVIQKKPELVVINLGEAQELAFMRKLQELGSRIPVFSTYGLESNCSDLSTLKLLEGVSYTYPYNAAAESRDKIKFDRDFSARFGAKSLPNISAYFARDGLVRLDKALVKCSAADTKCIFGYFTGLGRVEGISGTVEYKPDGSSDRPYRIKRVVNGQFTWLE
jgi:branched-chain amino acid transport system substrate-binding protein